MEDINARNFYEIETIENNWSLRELKRQVNSSLYERLVLSKDKEKVKELSVKGQIIEKAQDVIKDPYILEFLGLDEKSDYSEILPSFGGIQKDYRRIILMGENGKL